MKKIFTIIIIYCCSISAFSQYQIYSWGENNFGQLGNGSFTSSKIPVKIGNLNNWKTIFNGWGESFAINTQGELWAWGNNSNGQLGDGTIINRNEPVKIGNDTNWIKIVSLVNYTFGLKNDSTLWAWGSEYGNSPYLLDTTKNWKSIYGGRYHIFGIKNDGTLWGWGKNDKGQLGDGTNIEKKFPVQIGINNDWKFISCGIDHTMGVKSNGDLWGWGGNGKGQLGDSSNNKKNIPILVSRINNCKEVSCGFYHTLAIKNDGSLWTWGYNDWGQLGIGGTESCNIPTQVGTVWGTLNNWKFVVCYNGHSLAIKNEGTLWAWGLNDKYQLGINNKTNQEIPVQVGDENNWISITSGGYFSMALASDISSVNNNEINNLFIVSPNPSVDKLTINFNFSKENFVSIAINSIEGIRVKDYFIENTNNLLNAIELDIKDLPTGTYIVSLSTKYNTESKLISVIK